MNIVDFLECVTQAKHWNGLATKGN